MSGIICFDMDGTIADLYNVPDWLKKVRAENYSPYLDAHPLVDMDFLRQICFNLISKGWDIYIISWYAKNSSLAFSEATRMAKLLWLKKYQFPYTKAYFLHYGEPKTKCVQQIKKNIKILIDDNSDVRSSWFLGETIDPTQENWIEKLTMI